MKAIVLSGGGARGAYEAGVWKALKKLYIKYDIVTGTSIGALNGLLMVQKDYGKCLDLWKNISFDQLYDNFTTSTNVKDIYLSYASKILEGGVNTSKIEKLVTKMYNPYKLYHSKIKFGVVSFNLTTKSVFYATKDNTKPEKLKDYIMASATCFPVFQMKKIGNEEFVDGGYYDNLPINLAIDLGADEIIAVDLDAAGLKRKVKNKEIKITYIQPSSKIESFLMFEKNAANRMIKIGYNDTLKVFHKLEGNVYTFKKGTIYYTHQKNYDLFSENIKKYTNFPLGEVKKLLKKPEEFHKFLEEMLEVFEIDVTKIYNSKSLKEALIHGLIKSEEVSNITFEVEEIKKIFKRSTIVKYIYNKLTKDEKINPTIFGFFSKELAIAIYLITIRR